MAWDFGIGNKGVKKDSEPTQSSDTPKEDTDLLSVMGGADATADEPTGNSEPFGGIELSDPKPKRGRPKKDATNAKGKALDLFSPDGIGKLWVTAWDGFFNVCGAEKLSPEEAKQQREIFANWCKVRFPDTSDKYQPDILLVASLAFILVPRITPIAKTTAPWWRKLYDKVRGRKAEDGN